MFLTHIAGRKLWGNFEKGYNPVKTRTDHLTEIISRDGHKETPTQSASRQKSKQLLLLHKKKTNVMPQALFTN